MSKLVLDTAAMEEEFFADTALIGIASTLPAHRFCWTINNRFDMNFVREPEMDICMPAGKDQEHFFSVYQYELPLSGFKYLIYKLKSDKETLLPEVKQLDYLWLLHMHDNDHEFVNEIVQKLRETENIQLAQVLEPEKLKNARQLLV